MHNLALIFAGGTYEQFFKNVWFALGLSLLSLMLSLATDSMTIYFPFAI